MNYIKQLENDKANMQAEIDKMDAVLHEMYTYLSSSKFQGVDSRDGSMNNYVNTNDILDRIRQVMPFRNTRTMCNVCLVGYDIEDMTVSDGVLMCKECESMEV